MLCYVMLREDNNKKVASSIAKIHTRIQTRRHKQTTMEKTYTLFQTKTARKPHPLVSQIPI